jgi:hypothetical protein
MHLDRTTTTAHRNKMKKILEQCDPDSPKDEAIMKDIKRLIVVERYLKRYYDEPKDPEIDWKKLFLRKMLKEKVFGNLETELQRFYRTRHRSSNKYFTFPCNSTSKCGFCGQDILKDTLRISFFHIVSRRSCFAHASCDLWVRGIANR